MTSNQTSVEQHDHALVIIGQLLLGLLVGLPIVVLGNDFIVQNIGSITSIQGQRWLSEFIEQHRIWANIIYFSASMAVGMLGLPFFALSEKTNRPIFLIPSFVFAIPYSATVLIGFYRYFVMLWTVLIPAVGNFVAAYRLTVPVFLLIIIVAVTCSYAAYATRTFKRIHYGLIELLFGLASIVFAVYSVVVTPFIATSTPLTDSDVWQATFGFFAGVYIIVRGLTNIEDGLEQGPLTPPVIYGILVAMSQRTIAELGEIRLTKHASDMESAEYISRINRT